MITTRVELMAKETHMAKDWISGKMEYCKGEVLMLLKLYALYRAEGGLLSRRAFYTVVRERLQGLFPEKVVEVIKTAEGLAICNVSPERVNSSLEEVCREEGRDWRMLTSTGER